MERKTRITYREVFKKAIDRWGVEAQKDIAIEEMAELAKAIIKTRRVNKHDHFAVREAMLDVLEEIADVEIMVEQLRVIYNQPHLIHNAKKRKMRRLMKRLHMEPFNKD